MAVTRISLLLMSREVQGEQSTSDESGTDSEEELVVMLKLCKRKLNLFNKRKPVRIELYVERVVSNYSAQEFQSHFRVTRTAYEQLLGMVGPLLRRPLEVGRPRMNVEKQLLSVIWLLATPDSYRSVGERFNLGKSSLSVAFTRVIKALNEIAQQMIVWPSGGRLESIERKFRHMAGVPDVIGAVDGTYIPIKAPKQDAEVYINRKCDYAITCQAICDSELKYTDVYVGYPGSVSDTRIFTNSDIFQNIQRTPQFYFPNNQFIIGDKAYPVLTWCIPPYKDRGNLTAANINFNRKLSQTRQTIERSFALLFGRFRRLRFLDMNRTDLIPATVLAACVLHNVCLCHNDLLLEQYIEEGAPHVRHNDEVENLGPVGVGPIGHDRRNALCRRLYDANH